MSRATRGIVIALVAALLWPSTASAYLDPGIGSVLFQGIIAVVGAAAATVGLYWRSVTGVIRKLFVRGSDEPTKR